MRLGREWAGLRAEELRAEELRADELRAEQLRAEELRAEAWLMDINVSSFMDLGSAVVRLGREWAGLRAEELRAEELRADELRAEQLRAEELRAEAWLMDINVSSFMDLGSAVVRLGREWAQS